MSGDGQSPDPAAVRIHATTVALGQYAAVLRGASGSGKSDLALRFLAEAGSLQGICIGHGSDRVQPELPRRLVADDQTLLTVAHDTLLASAPASLAGRIEVRGVGIVDVAFIPSAQVLLIVDLVATNAVDRYPLVGETVTYLGRNVPLRRLAPFDSSAPLKLALMLAAAVSAGAS